MAIVVVFAKLLVAVQALAHPGTTLKLGALAMQWAIVVLASCPVFLAAGVVAVASVMAAARAARLTAAGPAAGPAA